MNQGIIAAILSIIFYLTSLLGGTAPQQATAPQAYSAFEQQTVSSIMGRRAVVLGEKIALRSGPDTTYPAITALSKGTEVTVLQAENGWYKVRFAGGRTGWIAGSSAALQPSERAARTKPTILGYYVLDSDSFTAVLDHGQILTSIAPSYWSLSSSGDLIGDFNPNAMGESLLFAGNHGLETYALIKSDEANVLLADPVAQEKAISNIINALEEWGVHGAHLSLGNPAAELADKLTAFTAKLAEALKSHELKISMDVPALTDNSDSSAYDYGALAEYVDFMVIMAYNQHHPDSLPGPVAGADWVEEVIRFALSQVPQEQLVLGLPTFGYDWPREGRAQSLSHIQAMETAAAQGVKVRWHSQHKAPYFTYGDGHEVWFENRYSLQAKLQLAESYGLRGVALWRLGQEDAGIWDLLRAYS